MIGPGPFVIAPGGPPHERDAYSSLVESPAELGDARRLRRRARRDNNDVAERASRKVRVNTEVWIPSPQKCSIRGELTDVPLKDGVVAARYCDHRDRTPIEEEPLH